MKVQIYKKGGFDLVTKDLNRRKAIRERCLNCVAWSPKEVEKCEFGSYPKDTKYYCPLYPYRLGVGKQDPKARNKAIRDHCLWCCADQPGEVWKCVSKYCPLFPYRKTKTNRSVECA